MVQNALSDSSSAKRSGLAVCELKLFAFAIGIYAKPRHGNHKSLLFTCQPQSNTSQTGQSFALSMPYHYHHQS
jgi:hypothetical protein